MDSAVVMTGLSYGLAAGAMVGGAVLAFVVFVIVARALIAIFR